MTTLGTPESVRELQRKLYLKSKKEKGFRFYMLYDKVYRDDVLREAWRRIRANGGAAGVDGKTIEEIEKEGEEKFLSGIRVDLKAKTYEPEAVKRVWIPKSNGKQRPLGIPTIKDRVVQMAAKIVIEPIYEADFESNSYGYRPNRNAQQALAEVKKYLNWGLVNVVDADIDDFFGNIPHSELMKLVAKRIVDKWILRLINMWLKAGIMEEGKVRNNTTGTPQGGVISPLLANIYLNELDKHWKEKGYDKRSQMNAQMVRYADDIMIFTDKTAREPLYRLQEKLGEMGLKLNREKTRIHKATEGSFDFLGFTFKKIWNRQRTKMFPLMIPSRKAVLRLKARIREITRPYPNKLTQLIAMLNQVLRGWVNYFRSGNASVTFNKIRHYTVMRIRRFIRKKQNRRGYGWNEISSEFLYGTLGLFHNYRVLSAKV